jgi:hypothetical protein
MPRGTQGSIQMEGMRQDYMKMDFCLPEHAMKNQTEWIRVYDRRNDGYVSGATAGAERLHQTDISRPDFPPLPYTHLAFAYRYQMDSTNCGPFMDPEGNSHPHFNRVRRHAVQIPVLLDYFQTTIVRQTRTQAIPDIEWRVSLVLSTE